MSLGGIFGIFRRDGAPLAPGVVETMRVALSDWGHAGRVWQADSIGLGQVAPRIGADRQPGVEATTDLVFMAAARVDNRRELLAECGWQTPALEGHLQAPIITDGELILHAYRRWGESCVNRIYGDWAFAAWQPAERKLFLARDHFGNTALYYYADPQVFAFASARQALQALNLAPVELDELYLAQVLIAWFAYHGERTIHQAIRRLPPAHVVAVTPDRLNVRQYWRLEDTPQLHLPRREEYVTAFREVFDEAVRARLRISPLGPSLSSDERPLSAGLSGIAVTLSGGLDSSSVAVTAARFLQDSGQRLAAFTAVPVTNSRLYTSRNFGDEWPFASATAEFAGNIDLCPVTAQTLSPIQAIRRMLDIHREPGHTAANAYWLLELEQAVQDQGHRVLLTGQMGNAGISWTGDIFSQPLGYQLHQLGVRRWVHDRLKRSLPAEWFAAWQRRRLNERAWYRGSAIRPEFAQRLNLFERRLADPNEQPPRTPLELRRFLMPGRSNGGARHAQMGAVHGLEIRDPTADARVLAFTFSVPDHVFIDPETGLDRWLIRAAMKDRLPDEVRLNRRRGRQAADLVPRLRACASEVETALDELNHGPAAAYVDVPYMRQVWQMIQTQDTPEAFRTAITILTRGIMAGLFVNDF